ncbi:hypothetical protein C9374_001371 [Naegleria lovaniensis]|uniref:Uncharacterized protein n=1 Tax=Naegleria lovaniensis TaxID=51637 RepID=A0AA88KS62_NAELO|nr:uncharacterized protein C9374_001371 [Naegleria lovaniensis]KAG2387777.1 hypothetical protein C9374_001371 [Naegleria lovaniensis]
MSEHHQIYSAIDSLFANPSDVHERKNLHSFVKDDKEKVALAYRYCIDEYSSKLENAFDDDAKSSVCYGASMIALICLATLKKADLSTIDDIFEIVNTKGFCICVDGCIREKNTKYIKLLKSFLTTLQTIAKEGKCARSMENIYEIHQLVMNFFEEMECNNNNKASSSDVDFDKEVELSIVAYTDFLTSVFTEDSFVNANDNFIFKYLLMCKSLFHQGLTNDKYNGAFIHLFVQLRSAVLLIQNYTENRRKQKSTEIKLDILRDVIAEICDSLQTKKNTTRKGIQMLVYIVGTYLPLLGEQKELILRSIIVSKTKTLFMPRKSNLVQETNEQCDQLFLMIPFEDNILDNNLTIKSTTTDPDVLHATSKSTLLTLYLKNCSENSPVISKFMEALIKQIKFCDTMLLNDTVDGLPLYHQIFTSFCELLMKNKFSNWFSEIQIVLWRELFDVSNPDITRDLCMDILAFLFNNNSGFQQNYLDLLKELIQTMSFNLFLCPPELRIADTSNQDDVELEWMIAEKVLRPFINKLNINDIGSLIDLSYDRLSDERISQAALLPINMLCQNLDTLFENGSKILNHCARKIAHSTFQPINVAYAAILRSIITFKPVAFKQGKGIISLMLLAHTNLSDAGFSDRYIEEAILTAAQILRKVENLLDHLEDLIEIIDCLRQHFWPKSERIRMCICYLIDTVSDKCTDAVEPKLWTCLKAFFEVALSAGSVSQVLLIHAIVNFILTNPKSVDTILAFLHSDMRPVIDNILSLINQGQIKGNSILPEQCSIDVQNEKSKQAMSRKRQTTAYTTSLQKVKPNIKTIQTISIVDQVAQVRKALTDLLDVNNSTSPAETTSATLLQQLEPHLKDISEITSKLFK